MQRENHLVVNLYKVGSLPPVVFLVVILACRALIYGRDALLYLMKERDYIA